MSEYDGGNMSVLNVNNVSIRYITGDFKDIGLKEYVMRKLTGNYQVNEFWADKNITFSLDKGEMLGIIGTNGAGKSTLLKVVSGIMEPTEGHVHREGNVAALLELASGFDGDLTVRENAYLRGAMLGYTRKFMDESYGQIIDFAELKEFEDRPFKQLSSGMKARLAFSVASMVQPDLLILDEVLSVGDGAFRKKSERKMNEIIHGGAATILVSHSLDQIRNLCTKILWLHKGKQIAFGDNVNELCTCYQRFLNGGVISVNQGHIQTLFSDVMDPSKTYYDPIYWAVDEKITSISKGAYLFHPEKPCTMEQVFTFLWRMMGRPDSEVSVEYTDVETDTWYYKPICWATETGLISGQTDESGKFGVGTPCTREQCILFLHHLAGTPKPAAVHPFSDIEAGSPYEEAISWAREQRITVGLNDGTGRFGAGMPCTRAAVITFLYRFSQSQNTKQSTH